MAKSYREAGVDIEKGDRFARFIGSLPSKWVSSGLGGFAGGVELPLSRYSEPVLLSTTDGVGTKVLLAKEMETYNTLGIDLVAMCVNDLLVCNCPPISFLDYLACGSLKEKVLQDLVKGIVEGCEIAQCTLTGGETAEMPDVYREEDFDLAGFCVGIAEKGEILPKKEDIAAGDPILGIPSSGIHSNGLSLARKAIPKEEKDLRRKLLTPTRIYYREWKTLFHHGWVRGAAHITGGGLFGNLRRLLPKGHSASFTWDWELPSIFKAIRDLGGIEEVEMRRVFNMGIGLALITKEEDKNSLFTLAEEEGIRLFQIGRVETLSTETRAKGE